jgi:hypothetical protein
MPGGIRSRPDVYSLYTLFCSTVGPLVGRGTPDHQLADGVYCCVDTWGCRRVLLISLDSAPGDGEALSFVFPSERVHHSALVSVFNLVPQYGGGFIVTRVKRASENCRWMDSKTCHSLLLGRGRRTCRMHGKYTETFISEFHWRSSLGTFMRTWEGKLNIEM